MHSKQLWADRAQVQDCAFALTGAQRAAHQKHRQVKLFDVLAVPTRVPRSALRAGERKRAARGEEVESARVL
jgi:hypothetical protein